MGVMASTVNGLLFITLYIGVLALSLWITYLIIRTAVKNGMIRAWEYRERARFPVK